MTGSDHMPFYYTEMNSFILCQVSSKMSKGRGWQNVKFFESNDL